MLRGIRQEPHLHRVTWPPFPRPPRGRHFSLLNRSVAELVDEDAGPPRPVSGVQQPVTSENPTGILRAESLLQIEIDALVQFVSVLIRQQGHPVKSVPRLLAHLLARGSLRRHVLHQLRRLFRCPGLQLLPAKPPVSLCVLMRRM